VRFCTGGLMMIQMDMLDMVEALVSLLLLFEDTPSVFLFFFVTLYRWLVTNWKNTEKLYSTPP
jgi:hypothetical protein